MFRSRGSPLEVRGRALRADLRSGRRRPGPSLLGTRLGEPSGGRDARWTPRSSNRGRDRSELPLRKGSPPYSRGSLARSVRLPRRQGASRRRRRRRGGKARRQCLRPHGEDLGRVPHRRLAPVERGAGPRLPLARRVAIPTRGSVRAPHDPQPASSRELRALRHRGDPRALLCGSCRARQGLDLESSRTPRSRARVDRPRRHGRGQRRHERFDARPWAFEPCRRSWVALFETGRFRSRSTWASTANTQMREPTSVRATSSFSSTSAPSKTPSCRRSLRSSRARPVLGKTETGTVSARVSARAATANSHSAPRERNHRSARRTPIASSPKG